MKKILLLLFTTIFFYSCSTDETPVVDQKQTFEVKDCFTVIMLENSSSGDYIYISKDSRDFRNALKYKVSNYRNYKLGQQICNLNDIK